MQFSHLSVLCWFWVVVALHLVVGARHYEFLLFGAGYFYIPVSVLGCRKSHGHRSVRLGFPLVVLPAQVWSSGRSSPNHSHCGGESLPSAVCRGLWLSAVTLVGTGVALNAGFFSSGQAPHLLCLAAQGSSAEVLSLPPVACVLTVASARPVLLAVGGTSP